MLAVRTCSCIGRKNYGSQIIHSALSINESGNLEVYLKGPNIKYEFTVEEITKAKNGNDDQYLSLGDNDMLAFELAVQQFRKDVADGVIPIDSNLPEYCYNVGDDAETAFSSVLDMGESKQAYWLIAGLLSNDTAEGNETDKINSFLISISRTLNTRFWT